MSTSAGYIEPKSHYEILDGLRGVASVLVVTFHVFETFTGGNRFINKINHGYLAVDFFFLLSGFVVAYAYDDRWGKMSQWDFYKRRLIRLQPMVVMGSIVGAALFYFQPSYVYANLHNVPVLTTLFVMLVGCTLIPLPLSMDIRGWQEMHPLDGPAWSLFFEYIANILYATLFRRFPQWLLSFFVIIFAGFLIYYTVWGPNGDVIGGWSLTPDGLYVGFTRLLYPFFAGVLLMRAGKLIRIKNAFTISSLLILLVMLVPRLGGDKQLWINGLYESFAIIVIFPLIVAIGAGGNMTGKFAKNVCGFLGKISYPMYITHYPIIYIFTAWVYNNKIPLGVYGLSIGLLVIISSISLAYACLKWYDEPVRKWLQNRYLGVKS